MVLLVVMLVLLFMMLERILTVILIGQQVMCAIVLLIPQILCFLSKKPKFDCPINTRILIVLTKIHSNQEMQKEIIRRTTK